MGSFSVNLGLLIFLRIDGDPISIFFIAKMALALLFIFLSCSISLNAGLKPLTLFFYECPRAILLIPAYLGGNYVFGSGILSLLYPIDELSMLL
jgi:hypothetical protein